MTAPTNRLGHAHLPALVVLLLPLIACSTVYIAIDGTPTPDSAATVVALATDTANLATQVALLEAAMESTVPIPWIIEVVDRAGPGDYALLSAPSLALDNGDRPCISYYNSFDGLYGNLKYAYRTEDGWVPETVNSEAGAYTSLALDGEGDPHISYYKVGPPGRLMYARRMERRWANYSIGVVGDPGGSGFGIPLALDGHDRPHLAYPDSGDDTLTHAHRDAMWTADWVFEQVDSGEYIGRYPSLALDSSDNAHVAYLDGPGATLKYARWSGTTWEIETVDTAGSALSLALDSEDSPHIGYCDIANEYLKIARRTENGWIVEIVHKGAGGYVSLALDSEDNPHISFYDAANQDLAYARWTSSGWVVTTVDSAGDVGQDASIALGKEDIPYIVYYDATNGELKLAYRQAEKE